MSDKIQAAWNPLDESLNKLFSTLEKFSNDQLNQALDVGKWSVLQHLEHLYLSESASLAYINKKKQYPETLIEVDHRADQAVEAIRAYMNNPNPPIPAVAPEHVTPVAAIYEFSEISEKWSKLRKEMKDVMFDLGEDMMTKDLYRHPFAGKMGLYHAIEFFDIHFNHHMKAINKFLNK